jgi:hypothetical protein
MEPAAMKIDQYINLLATWALELDMPPALLARAAEVIE